MDRLAREQPEHTLALQRDPPDAFLEMLGRKGTEAEAVVLRDMFVARGLNVADLSGTAGLPRAERAARTATVLRDRPDVVYQAPLAGGGFFGVVDFLVRADVASAVSAESGAAAASVRWAEPSDAPYVIWDSKLARRARPQQVLQLCCYAEMLQSMLGRAVSMGALLLDGEAARVLPVLSPPPCCDPPSPPLALHAPPSLHASPHRCSWRSTARTTAACGGASKPSTPPSTRARRRRRRRAARPPAGGARWPTRSWRRRTTCGGWRASRGCTRAS